MRDDERKFVDKLTKEYNESFALGMNFSMGAEGGISNHNKDSGGLTYRGIASRWNPNWSGWRIVNRVLAKYPEIAEGYDRRPVTMEDMNRELEQVPELDHLVHDFYYNKYWKRTGAELMPYRLGVVLFDASILTGVRRSVKNLQKALKIDYEQGIVADGIFGSNTLRAMNEAINEDGSNSLTKSVLLEYVDTVYEKSRIGDNREFLAGWISRTRNLKNYVFKN